MGNRAYEDETFNLSPLLVFMLTGFNMIGIYLGPYIPVSSSSVGYHAFTFHTVALCTLLD